MTAGSREEERSLRTPFVVLSVAFAVVTVWAIADEVWVRRPWKAHQAALASVLPSGEAGSIAIRQLVVPALDVVDRCPSCHLGATDPRLDGPDVPPVLRTHPGLDTLLVAHPPERFGCTPCHEGQGLALTAGTAHGEDDPHWSRPLLEAPYEQSSCGRCHAAAEALDGAPLYTEGRSLFRTLRCGGCHFAGEDVLPPREAPSLRRIASKMPPGALVAWIQSPEPRRGGGDRMPQFWPGADTHPELARQRDVESTAIAAYLLDASEPFPQATEAPAADPLVAEEGRRLFDRVGCRGCHAIGRPEADDVVLAEEKPAELEDAWAAFGGGDDEDEALEEEPEAEAEEAPSPSLPFGPTLGEVGARTGAAWLHAWLRRPADYWPEATMPRMRLTEPEAHAIASWLVTLASSGAPAVPAALDGTLDRTLVDEGQRLVATYGCAGCHDIPGFEGEGPPGPDLVDYGRKDPHDMDFGRDLVPRRERTWAAFTEAKLAAPRSLARPEIALTMPDYGLDEDETLALAVYLRGLRAAPAPAEYLHPGATSEVARHGARVVAERGCGSCHGYGGEEPAIARHYAEPHLRPPPLEGVAAKLRPQWFYDYLLVPGPLRPWLEVRMPDFALTPDDAAGIVAFFAELEGVEGPLRPMGVRASDPARAAAGASLFATLKCVSCHLLDAELEVESAELAPDLALARQRLDPAWVRAFLKAPATLLPQTKMPQFFPNGQTPVPDLLGGDADAQIALLVDHLMNLGLQPAPASSTPEVPTP